MTTRAHLNDPRDASTPGPTDPERHFAIALQSPARVGDKDRDGWVGLFHADGFVEDPVEAGRYQGRAKIETFWDVFIGPQPSVAFDVHRDFWAGDTLIRQATVVNVTEADATEQLRVPALIRYELREGRVGSLQAVWEPPKIIAWFGSRGLAGARALTKHGFRMMRKAGLGNALTFGGTVVGGLGRDRARTLVEALRSGDVRQWAERVGGATVVAGGPERCETFDASAASALRCIEAHTESISRLAVGQLLVCGNHVAAFLTDPDEQGALALMMRADGHGRVEQMDAIWSPAPRVLGEGDVTTSAGTGA